MFPHSQPLIGQSLSLEQKSDYSPSDSSPDTCCNSCLALSLASLEKRQAISQGGLLARRLCCPHEDCIVLLGSALGNAADWADGAAKLPAQTHSLSKYRAA